MTTEPHDAGASPAAQLAGWLDTVFVEEGRRFLAEVPAAAHLTDRATPLDPSYYLRHRIETVRRIRLTGRTDALALAAMVREDYDAARLWARYTCVELGHDVMFLDDLSRHGIDAAQVERTAPFAATQAMLRYLEDEIGRLGSLPAVAYSLFVEWNSARFSEAAVDRAAAAFTEDHVRGSRSHLEVDVEEDHYMVMVDVAARLLASGHGRETLDRLIRDIASYFRDYFVELHGATRPVARLAG